MKCALGVDAGGPAVHYRQVRHGRQRVASVAGRSPAGFAGRRFRGECGFATGRGARGRTRLARRTGRLVARDGRLSN